MDKNHLFFFVSIFLLTACGSSTPPEQKATVEKYTNHELGWSITIPAGFQSLSKSRVQANEKKGREAIAAAGTDVQTDSLIHLINFQKNQFNLFSATMEPFKSQDPSAYEANNQLIKKLIYDAYAGQKIKVDTSSGKKTVAKHSFSAFYIKIYGPNGSLLMNQEMYSSLINGYDFGVNINYNNEYDKKLLLAAFNSSTFVDHK